MLHPYALIRLGWIEPNLLAIVRGYDGEFKLQAVSSAYTFSVINYKQRGATPDIAVRGRCSLEGPAAAPGPAGTAGLHD